MDDIYYDPYDYALDAHPHPMWKRMRDEAPLYYNEKFDFFAVSRFADVREVSADWRTFSSHYGSVLELIDHPEILEQARNMLFEDPPIHDDHRSVLARAFTPRRISGLEPQIRDLCRGYLDALPSEFDFVRDYGARIPMMVIGMLLGVPEEDRERLRELADQTVHRDEGETEHNIDAQMEMLDYFRDYVAGRRAEPMDDLMSDLVHAVVETADGGTRHMEDLELLQYMTLIAAAGNETVANLMGWAGMTLSRHPDERAALVDDPTLIPNAVEELLRYEAPSPIQARVVTRRRRAPRPDAPRPVQDRPPHRIGGPRRAGVPRRRPVRRAPAVRAAHGLRPRHPLLPRGGVGAPRVAHRAGGDARPPSGVGGRRGPGRDGAHQHGPGVGPPAGHGVKQPRFGVGHAASV